MRLFWLVFLGIVSACGIGEKTQSPSVASSEAEALSSKLRVIFDTDANNELDDQHALAYLLFSGDQFEVAAITVNETRNGGPIANHMDEAKRVVALCGLTDKVAVLQGASGAFEEIDASQADYDGAEAVEFIIAEARKASPEVPLLLLPVGKLTNIALAVQKAPDIRKNVRMVWLGSNYPAPGEYNQVNDIPSMNYLLNQDISFEMVTVRYGEASGTDAVRVTPEAVSARMPGLGVRIAAPQSGRHGGSFQTFGDYAVDLFSHAEMHGDPPSRALFDMAAVAITKQADWASKRIIPAPQYVADEWVEQPDNERKIILWENFDQEAIIADFFATLENPVPVNQ